MGLVYRCWDENVGHDVVVKVPRRSMMDDPGFAARFKDEIRSLIKLPHPHIVKVFDLGEYDGLPFAVMQFLPGGSLEDRVYHADGSVRPMSPATLAGWLPHVAKALQFMHGENYVHRDVKPANILFDAQGNAYLSDFGVHKALASGQTQAKARTGTGMVLGTPHYMAPELAQGDAVDSRIDQYALAVTVHEVLSGQKPFDGPTGLAIMFSHVNQPTPRLDAVVRDIPQALAEAVLRGLQKDPADRFKSCSAFAAAVLAGVGGAVAKQPGVAGGTAQQPRVGGGTAALSPLPVASRSVSNSGSQAIQGTQKSLRPVVPTMAMAGPAPVPIAQPSAAPSSYVKRPKKNPAVAWLTSSVGIATISAVAFLMVGLAVLSSSSSGKKGGGGGQSSSTSSQQTDQTTDPSPDPKPDPNLPAMVAEWNRKATEVEADMPPTVSDILKRLEYTNDAELRNSLEQADADRDALAADERLDELHKLAGEIASENRVQDRLARIDNQLKTSVADSPQATAELETLAELDRMLRSWQPVTMTQAVRTRANQYIEQKENRALQYLGACALLRNNSLPDTVRNEMLRNWEAAYSEQRRAEICMALVLSGNRDLVDEAMLRINKEPRLLGMYNPEDLFAAIEGNRALWQPARDALTSHFASSNAERVAAALGPPAVTKPPVPPEMEDLASTSDESKTNLSGGKTKTKKTKISGDNSKPVDLRQLGGKSKTTPSSSAWTVPISLPGGGILKPGDVQLQGFQLTNIDRGMPKNAYSYKNPNWPSSEPQVRSAYSLNKGQSLKLDGYTVVRQENGSPRLVVKFDDDDRDGPLRFWDDDGNMRLYADYKNDRLHGLACLFENGMPAVVMSFEGDLLRAQYLVDHSGGSPVARPANELPPDVAGNLAEGAKKFKELSDYIEGQEKDFKKQLKDAFEVYQRKWIAQRNKVNRQRSKMNEARSRAEYEAGVARTVGAMTIAGGGGLF